MWNQYVDICGISEQERHDNLEPELHEIADKMGMTYEETYTALHVQYKFSS